MIAENPHAVMPYVPQPKEAVPYGSAPDTHSYPPNPDAGNQVGRWTDKGNEQNHDQGGQNETNPYMEALKKLPKNDQARIMFLAGESNQIQARLNQLDEKQKTGPLSIQEQQEREWLKRELQILGNRGARLFQGQARFGDRILTAIRMKAAGQAKDNPGLFAAIADGLRYGKGGPELQQPQTEQKTDTKNKGGILNRMRKQFEGFRRGRQQNPEDKPDDEDGVDSSRMGKLGDYINRLGATLRTQGPEATRSLFRQMQEDPDFRDSAFFVAFKLGLRVVLGPVGAGVAAAIEIGKEERKTQRAIHSENENALKERLQKKFFARVGTPEANQEETARPERQGYRKLTGWLMDGLRGAGRGAKEIFMIAERIGYTFAYSANRKQSEVGDIARHLGFIAGEGENLAVQDSEEVTRLLNEKLAQEDVNGVAETLQAVRLMMRDLVDLENIDYQLHTIGQESVKKMRERLHIPVERKLDAEELMQLKQTLESFVRNNGELLQTVKGQFASEVSSENMPMVGRRLKRRTTTGAIDELIQMTSEDTATAYANERAYMFIERFQVVDGAGLILKSLLTDAITKSLNGNGEAAQSASARHGSGSLGHESGSAAKDVSARDTLNQAAAARETTENNLNGIPSDWQKNMSDWIRNPGNNGVLRPPVSIMRNLFTQDGHPLSPAQVNFLNHAYLDKAHNVGATATQWYLDAMKKIAGQQGSPDDLKQLEFQAAAFRIVNANNLGLQSSDILKDKDFVLSTLKGIQQ